MYRFGNEGEGYRGNLKLGVKFKLGRSAVQNADDLHLLFM